MIAKDKWGWGIFVLVWTLPLFGIWSLIWRAVWVSLIPIVGAAAWLVYRSNPKTERGLERLSNVLLGFVIVQILVVAFIVFEAAQKR